MARPRKPIPGVDAKLLIKDASLLMPDPARRAFLRGAASLGALTMLTGCDIVDGVSAENMLRKIATFNDGVQALILADACFRSIAERRTIATSEIG